MSQYLRRFLYAASLLAISCILYSCANMSSPSGGEFDYDPPKVVRSTPTFNALEVTKGRVVIVFDELVQLENQMEKVIVTPPQKAFPVIQAINNRVVVELRDTLLANTTYTIDFTDAIVDNNEKNVLENFSISFSTGKNLDSLAVSGRVLSANNLEPVKGMYVGLHQNLNDSAFTTLKFDKISRTNDRGLFTIKGVAEGKYRIYALDDFNRDYKYDNPSESVAFLDSIVVPSYTGAYRTDTVFKADLTIDTIVETAYTRFLPDDLVLRSFLSDFKRQYLQKYERLTDDVVTLFFGAPTEMPKIVPLNFEPTTDWGLLEKSITNDTLRYWITDPHIYNMDTLKLQVEYYRTDSLNQPVLSMDTLNLINRNKASQQKERERLEKEREKQAKSKKGKEVIDFFQIKTNLSSSWDVYNLIRIEFEKPVADFDSKKIQLQYLVDSTYIDKEFVIQKDSLNPRLFSLKYKWLLGAEYRFAIDSAAFHGYDGRWNDVIESKFKVRNADEYGNLYFNLSNIPDSVSAFVELLDSGDKPVRKSTVKGNGVLFSYLNPAKYYARIILDRNNNGVWDTGDYHRKLQPEEVYYYDKYVELKANWDIEEDWNILALPLEKQKPLDITKNKPVERESKKRQMQRQEEKERKAKEQQQQTDTNNLNNSRISQSNR